MAKTKYGVTWWGQRWLNALSRIDCANRLPRGKKYADNGAVKELKVSDGRITAKVDGRMRQPYSLTLSMSQFTKKQKGALAEALSRYPSILLRLMSHQLDPQVADIADELGIRLFPESWRSLKMSCSCPDSAVPCKHLAAVIYKLSQEIDNNPFILFSLHGMSLESYFRTEDLAVKRPAPMSEFYSKELPSPETPVFDLSIVRPIGRSLTLLLPPSPAFDNTFNISAAYPRFDRNFFLYLRARATEDCLPDFISLEIDRNGQSTVATTSGNLSTAEYASRLYSIEPSELRDHSETVAVLKNLVELSVRLVSCGAIVPKIFNVAKGYRVLWTPAVCDKAVQALTASYDGLLPEGSVKVKGGGIPRSRAYVMLTHFITALINESYTTAIHSDVESMFYRGTVETFSALGDKEKPGAIKSWLDNLENIDMRYRPVIQVGDSDDGFTLSIEIADSEHPEIPPVSLREILTSDEYAPMRHDVLRIMSPLYGLVPKIDFYLNNGAEHEINLSDDELLGFLDNVVPSIRILGLKVMLPKALENISRPKVSGRLSMLPHDADTSIRLDNLLSFDWRVALGDDIITTEEFGRLTENAGRLLRFRDRYFYADEATIASIRKALMSPPAIKPQELLQRAFSGESGDAAIEISSEVKKAVERLRNAPPAELPADIRATLRPYQQRGFEWMYRNMEFGFGSILADDMGLGKTLQVITLMQKLREEGRLCPAAPALVVVPTGLMDNWVREIDRFAPSLTTHVYHGASRELADTDVVITSYGMARSDAALLKKKKWSLLAVDEAQNIKNPATAQTKAVKALKADVRIAMSGTPVENRLAEYWSVMDFVNQGYFSSLSGFRKEFAQPIESLHDSHKAEIFRKISSPFMLRRLKSDKDIISDLPEKVEVNDYATLAPAQAALYHKVVEEAIEAIAAVPADSAESLFKRSGLVLQMILALKQICNHPAQYLKNGEFSPSMSGKSELLLDLVDSISNADEKALIFTQFTEMGDALCDMIAAATGRRPLYLHGGCSTKVRTELVDRFQTCPADRFFVLSLKAGGTGLNLTAASNVIHYDLWWNPAVEAQATDRAYRIGQTKNVMVHRLICRDTFEEKINDMINDKRRLADLTVSAGETWLGRLSDDELKEIFR